MNYRILSSTLIALCVVSVMPLKAQPQVNLTPLPRHIEMGAGKWVMPTTLRISTVHLPDSMRQEVERFAARITRTTGRRIQYVDKRNKAADLRFTPSFGALGEEGYRLNVASDGINVSAATRAGLFYALQSICKMLPANVVADKEGAAGTAYEIPALNIIDSPRFGYRGYMLDVSRHFFDVTEIKRMIDLMAIYKLNRFHWHLTDDQGWRLPIKAYPRLTQTGATRKASWDVDWQKGRVRVEQQYGPYSYTREEIIEVVNYAKERHIEVVPEVDMPGHFCAAMAAYPEFSCTPNGQHEVWTEWGVSTDVLNVANPAAVKFCCDVLDEIMELFPYPVIHIGGDECPTNAWENNEACRRMVDSLKLGSFRALQTHFISQLSAHVAKRGRRLMVWNEAISSRGSNLDAMKATNAIVMCWYPCNESARLAAKVGMDNIVTPFGPYYINRKQSKDAGEPFNAGNGSDDLEATYRYLPVPDELGTAESSRYIGVQATMWTEHISSNELLEYAALPRLLAVAEAAWTPECRKNFTGFLERVQADATLFDLGHYRYGRHYMKR